MGNRGDSIMTTTIQNVIRMIKNGTASQELIDKFKDNEEVKEALKK